VELITSAALHGSLRASWDWNKMMDATPTRLTPHDVAALLASTSATLQAELEALPPALATWHPAPGEWCANDVLGHLIEAERRGFAGRIRTILSADEPFLPDWDQREVARQRRDCARSGAEVLGEFVALREASVELVRGLTPADLSRGGTHEKVGYLRVADLLHEWVHHDRNHVRQLLANVQATVWPYMGNARKFSGD
jgi:hypothetical protein